MNAKNDEWVVYRLKKGKLKTVPRRRWDGWLMHNDVLVMQLIDVVVAEGLTKDEALRFVALSREE